MKRKWFLFVAVILLSGFVAYRAIVIPITHDEASTWLNFRHYNLWSCLSNYYCWQSANNHWLNSLLMQWSASIFGDTLLGLRLPNVLAGALYFISATLISTRYIKNIWLQIAGFFLLCAHLYLLDFFSLFRGYGLVMCGMLWGIYSLLRYGEHYHLRWLVACVCIMFLSVLSNFTAILPFLSMGLLWFGWVVVSHRFSLILKHGFVWLVFSGLLYLLLSYPFRIFRNEGELVWGSKNLWALSIDLAKNLLYGFPYGSDHISTVLVLFLLFIFFLSGLFVLLHRKFNSISPVILALCFLMINLGVIFLYQKGTGSSMPIGRKSTYLIPVIFTPLALCLGLIRQNTVCITLGLFVSGILLFHSFRPHAWASSREWYYDAYYPELFSSILHDQQPDDSIRLGSSWIFYPSLAFYQQARNIPLSGLAYQRPLIIDSTRDYFFVESADSIGMHAHGFALAKNIGPFFLFRKISEPIIAVETKN